MSHLKRSASAATFEPKFIHYLSDGTGRDSYVTFTNGGMWKDEKITKNGPQIGTFAFPRKWQPPGPQMVPKFQHYFSDGTGRDSYVMYNQDEGGLAPSSMKFKKKQNFFTSLRDHQKRPPTSLPTIPDYFYMAQSPLAQSLKSFQKNEDLKISQKHLTRRLHQTKIVEDPYKKIRKLSQPCYKGI